MRFVTKKTTLKITYLLFGMLLSLGSCSDREEKQPKKSFTTFMDELEAMPVKERESAISSFLEVQESFPIIEGKDTVHFVWYGQADTLMVEGDQQNAWTKPELLAKIESGEKDFFYRSYTPPSDAILEYRYIQDGQRILDTLNTEVSQSFDYGDRNIFGMPDFRRDPILVSRNGIDKGTLYRWVFRTEHPDFSNSSLVWIYTPQGYDKEKEYPVLYVYDAIWAVFSRPTINVVDNLIADGTIPPIVVVFVSFEDRWNEYVAKSTAYSELMAEELVPFIEDNFAVTDDREERAIIGASAGGHAAIVTALRHPEVFSNVASQGGGAGGFPDLNELPNEALDVYLEKREQYPLKEIYSEVGTFDLQFRGEKMIDGARQFHQRLTDESIDHRYLEVNSGHTGTSWDQRLDDILIQFFKY